jgi:hypothetical protein
VACAIEVKPRSDLLYSMGFNVLVTSGADAPLRCQGARY